MNRRLTLLLGVLVLAVTYACNEGTTAVRMPTPSFQWQEALPPPPPLTVSITADANNPQPYEPGDYTFIANVSGGSGVYTYHWYWRGCNVNWDEEWCPPDDQYFSSYQNGSSFTTYLGAYDTRLDVVVEVQDTAGYNPPAGKAYLYTPGSQEGFIGVVHGNQLSCLLPDYPFHRYEVNPNNGLPEWVPYGRNPCTGAVFYFH